MSMVTVHGPNTMYDGEAHEVKAGAPSAFPVGQEVPANLAELRAEVAPFPTYNPWINGQYVVLLDAAEAHWDGNSWETGRAPNAPAMPEINGAYRLLPDGDHVYWDGTGWANGNAPDATVTAGKPGVFTPTGYEPADLAGLAADLFAPAARWVNGEYVHLADTTEAYFDGTSWIGGEGVAAPADALTGVQAGIPGKFLPDPYYADLKPANITALRAHAVVGTTAMGAAAAWTTGQYVIVGASTHVHWDGAAWTSGDAT